jgi:hypothetical protein
MHDIHMRRSTLSVIDQRGLAHPLPVLQQMLAETGAQVWAEGEAKEKLAAAQIPAADRTGLVTVETLVIWSTPPGRTELQAALEASHPRSVVLFGVDPSENSAEAFLRRLAGLGKFTVDKLSGQAPLSRLAGAVAQREACVRLGLQWLHSRGMFSISWIDAGIVQFSPGGETNQKRADELLFQLKTLVEEVSAYRVFFHQADKDRLF